MALRSRLLVVFTALALLITACASDDPTVIDAAQDLPSPQPNDATDQDVVPNDAPADDQPKPVEPDGGIGDGAEPLPGAADVPDDGTWHGAQVAETNCPGTAWKRVQAAAFSFSVPVDFSETDVRGIDSEVGAWRGADDIEVSYDYGWYSGTISDRPGVETEVVDYSGVAGAQSILRDGDTKFVEVFFGQVAADVRGAWDRLSLLVAFSDASDEIIGRCIVGSIEWSV